MPENIYGEIIPDRFDLNASVEKEYPTQLIITIDSLQNPTLGSISTSIRNHILECSRSSVNPDVVLNFCIEYVDPNNPTEHFFQKFISLAEYINDIKSQLPDLTLTLSVRGYFLSSMIPLLYLDLPIKVSKGTYIISYSEDSPKIFKGLIEDFITNVLGKNIIRPFKIDKSSMLEQNLITI